MEEAKKVKLAASVDMSEVDEAINKVERLNQLLNEAKTLAGKLASTEITVVCRHTGSVSCYVNPCHGGGQNSM